MASEYSCETILKSLASEFKKQHINQNLCDKFLFNGNDDDDEYSTSLILRHIDECLGVAHDVQSQTTKIDRKHLSPRSDEHLITFKSLCDSTPRPPLLTTDSDRVIISSNLSNEHIRMVIRYLLGKGYDLGCIVICSANGRLRALRDNDIHAPQAPLTNNRKKRKLTESN